MAWITVKEMYQYAVKNELNLLSDFNATFWDEYKTNHLLYDKKFTMFYSSYRFFYQSPYGEEPNEVATVTTDFIEQVYTHLLVNKKKYEELYRIASIDDTKYDFMNNIDITTTRNGSSNNSATMVSGSRSDIGSNTDGSRTDTNTIVNGSHTDTNEKGVSAFNESNYTNAEKITNVKGEETDTTTLVKGEQNNSNSFTKGEETDTSNGSASHTETTNRKGLVSKDSESDLIKKHLSVWDGYKFYAMVFNEIAKEMLLI